MSIKMVSGIILEVVDFIKMFMRYLNAPIGGPAGLGFEVCNDGGSRLIRFTREIQEILREIMNQAVILLMTGIKTGGGDTCGGA